MAAPIYNPFDVGVQQRRRPSSFQSDPLTPGARQMVDQFTRGEAAAQRAAAAYDPIDEEVKSITERRTNIRLMREGVKNTRDKFLETEGTDLFERDPLTGKLMKSPEGGYVPKLGAEVESLKARTQQKTGFIAGAFSPSKQRGDPTAEAEQATRRLSEIEPVWRLKQQKYDRIQAEMKRLDEADMAFENRLADLARAREARYTVTPQNVASAVRSVNASRAATGAAPVTPKDVASIAAEPTKAKAAVPDYNPAVFTPLADQRTGQPAGRAIAPEAVQVKARQEAAARKLDPVGAETVELARLRDQGVTHVGDRPIAELLAERGGDEAVATVKTLETVKKLTARIADLNNFIANAGDKMRPKLEKERAVLGKMLEQKQGLIDKIPVGERIKSALGSFVSGLAEIGAGTLDSIAISSKRLEESMPAWLVSLAGDDPTGKTVDQLQTAIWAKELREFAERVAPQDPRLAEEFWSSQVPQGIGSMAGFLMGGAAGRAAKISPTLTTLVLGSATGGSQGYREAIAAGADEETARMSFLLNAGVGTSEVIPISRMFARLSKATKGKAMDVLLDAGVEGFEEFAQEFFQTTAGNAIAISLYDENRELFEGAGASGAAGGVSGVLASLVMSAIPGRQRGGSGATPAPGTSPTSGPDSPTQPQPEGGDANEGQVQGEGPKGQVTPPEAPPTGNVGDETSQPATPAPEEETGETEKSFEVTTEDGKTTIVTAPSLPGAIGKLPAGTKVKSVREVEAEPTPTTPESTTPAPAPAPEATPAPESAPAPEGSKPAPTPGSTPAPGGQQPAPASGSTTAPGSTPETPPAPESETNRPTPAPEAGTPPPSPAPTTPEPTTPEPPTPAPESPPPAPSTPPTGEASKPVPAPAPAPGVPRAPSKAGLSEDDDNEIKKAFEGMDFLKFMGNPAQSPEPIQAPENPEIAAKRARLEGSKAKLTQRLSGASAKQKRRITAEIAAINKSIARMDASRAKQISAPEQARLESGSQGVADPRAEPALASISTRGPSGGAGSAPNPRSGAETGAAPAPALSSEPTASVPRTSSSDPQATAPAAPAKTLQPSTAASDKSRAQTSTTPAPGSTVANVSEAESQSIIEAMAEPSAGKPSAKYPQKGIKPDKFQAFIGLAQRLFSKITTPESLAEELDRVLDKKGRAYTQALWNGFRMMNPDLDPAPNWDAIYDKIDGVVQDAPAPTPAPPPAPAPESGTPPPAPAPAPKNPDKPATERDQINALADAVKTRLLGAIAGKIGPLTRAELKKIASDTKLDEKTIDEAAELGVVLAVRSIAADKEGGTVEQRFDQMVKLYEAQPNLTSKTAVSKINQAYSTPAPLAWFTAIRSAAPAGAKVAEPTAGNGILLADRISQAEMNDTLANEIDPTRRANLESQGFGPTSFDATSPEFEARLREFAPTVIRMNPPFGAVKDEGSSREFPLPNPDNPKLTTTNIDHAITLSSLQHMTPDGKAVLIIGSGGGKAVDAQERAKAYMAGIKQSYFYYLYRQYNVVEHFTLDGDLYAKQGAGWPIDVIVIDGKGKSALPFPWSKPPAYLTSWNDLRNRITQGAGSGQTGGTGGQAPVPPGSGGTGDGQPGQPGESGTPGSGTDTGGTDTGGRSGSGDMGSAGNSGPSGGTGSGSGDSSAGSGAGTGPGAPGTGVPQSPEAPETGPKPVEPTEGGFQAKYSSSSKSPQSADALTPTNLVTPQQRALERLRQTRGDIDQFVAAELGYKNVAELYKHLDGTQVDAVGLAINNVLRGGALINTDQTGMGKGRTAAAMIRYAVRRGKVPIFITENPGLYRDMMRDLEDIGSEKLRPLMTNAGETIVHDDADGNVKVKISNPDREELDAKMEKMIETGRLPSGHHMIFTSYSQIGSDVIKNFKEDDKEKAKRKRKLLARPDGIRMRLLRRFAQDGMVVLDEAHGAGGMSDVGWRVTQMLSGFNDQWVPIGPKARPFGIYYLSATYAKRPENMGVYFETDIKRAVQNPNELTGIMQQGGVPMQQVLSSMLAENGQLVRRELDFKGVKFPTVYTTQRKDGTIDEAKQAKEKRLADSFTEPLRETLDLNQQVSILMGILQRKFNEQGIKTADGKTLKHSVKEINFGSLLHNMVNQYLISIKADSIAESAIEQLKQGKSPVIALYNTMESVYDKLDGTGLSKDFNGLLEHYLSQATTATLRNPDGSTRKVRINLDDLAASFPELDEIPASAKQLASRMAKQRDVIRDLIRETDRSELPVSPIDRIRHRIEDAGFKTGEISGRGEALDRKGNVVPRPGREKTKKGHNEILGEFNRDKKVALILTKSGSTGISAHASAKFRNQQQRVMVVGQLQPDINAMIQMFGRVFRKGQVSIPEYVILNTSIPAENRLAAFLSRKLASLNANTTSSAKGVTTEAGGVDFLNKYGDEVVYKFLQEHPEIVAVLRYNFPDGQLPVFDEQSDEGAINAFKSGYGTGDFARSVTGEIAILSVDDQVAFYNSVIEEYVAKIKHLDEIGENDLVAENLPLEAETTERRVIFQGQGDTVFDGGAYLETVKTKVGRKPLDPDEIEALAADPRKRAAKLRNEYPAIANAANDKAMKELQEKKGHLENWPEIRQNAFMVARERVSKIMRGAQLVGRPVLVGFADGTNAVGYVTDFKFDDKKPLTPSAHELTIHLNTERVKITVPMSALERITEFQGFDWKENYRNLMSLANKRQIITGNLLAGFSAARRLLADKGGRPRVVTYTTNKGEVLQGVMMPNSFNPQGSIVDIKTGEQLIKALKQGEAVSSLGGAEFFWKDDAIEIRVPSSKSAGGRYWQDQRLLALVRGMNMKQVGSSMIGAIDPDNAENTVKLFNETLSDKLSYIEGVGTGTGGPKTEVSEEQKKLDESVDGKTATEALQALIKSGVFDQQPAVKKIAEWAATFTVNDPVTVIEASSHPAAQPPGVLGFWQDGFALQPPEQMAQGSRVLNWINFRGIALIRGRWNRNKTTETFSAGHVLLHEYVHALTVRFIRRFPDHKTVKLLDELARYSYELAKKEKDGSHTEYGYSTINRNEPSIEFITELFSNKEFQRLLARQQAPQWAITQRIKSVWEAVVDAIRKILMLPPRTMLDESLNTSTQLVESAVQQFKPGNQSGGKVLPIGEIPLGAMIYVVRATPRTATGVTPAQRDIINKRLGTLEDNRTVIERVKDLVAAGREYMDTELRQKLLDRYHSIRRLEKAILGDAKIDASASAYKWARLTQNLPAVMEHVLRFGPIEYRAGSMSRRKTPMVYEDGNIREEFAPRGLVEILKPLVDSGMLKTWEGYVAAYRANGLMKEGRENNFKSQAEIDELLSLGQTYPEFEKVRREYVAFQRTVLDVAQAAGLINATNRAMWEKADYVPFYRIMDAMDEKRGMSGPYKRRGIANQRSGIKRLKGGENAVDIIENIYRNIETLLDASFKNIAMQRVAELAQTQNDLIQKIPYKSIPFKSTVEEAKKAMEAQGVDTSSISPADLQEIITFWRMRAPQGKDVVSVMRNGKAEYFRVKDGPLLRSILAIGPDRHSFWMHLLQAPKRLLTNAVTLDPAFMIANTIRDSLSAWVVADSPIRPGIDSAIGFLKSVRNDPSRLSIMAAGGGSGHYNRISQGEVRKRFDEMTPRQKKDFLDSIVDSPGKVMRMWKDLSRSTENANRIAIYDSAIKSGASEAEAAFQALDIMDFGLRGDSKLMNFFFDTVPFLNARVQGLYKLGRSSGVGQGQGLNRLMPKGRFATHGAIVALGSLALLLRNWDDDRYWDLQEWDRDIYYHFWIGDQHFRIPKPFEVGQIFSTLPERMFEFLGKTGDGKILGRRILTMLADTFAMNPTPQALKPLAERAMNLNTFTGRPIISRGDEFRQPEQQFNVITSETMREMAEAMPDSAPAWMRSPKTLEHFVRGYFGSLGMYALTGADAVTRAVTDAPNDPAVLPNDFWVMKRFAPSSDQQETKYVAQFYDLHREITGLVRQIKELQKTDPAAARQLQAENADLVRFAPRAEASYDVLNSLRRQEQGIYDSNASPEEKRRRLAEITTRRNSIAQTVVQSGPRRSAPIFNPFAN